MMLGETGGAVHAAAETLAGAGRHLAAADPGPGAFGAGGLGLLGEIGRETYARFQGALDARAREVQRHAERVRDLAVTVGRSGDGFADAERGAGRAVSDDGDAPDGVA
jgi:hypothetical protein